MLVLSRKLNEKILFPGIQASVEVVAIRGNVVRLGIQAPHNVAVVREEIKDRPNWRGNGPSPKAPPTPLPLPREVIHQMRNRLNAASIGLALLRKQHQLGMHDSLGATLDKIEQEMQALRRQFESPADAPAPAPPRRPTKVGKALLVEDDQNERELLAAYLRMAGLDVDVASDGQDALDYLHTHQRPDVVLMDLALPRCDGPTAIREIRSDPAIADVKIFAVTGRKREQFSDGGSLRVDRWFNKPLNAEDLLRDLRREIAGEG
jgi:carbon storage regulator CsrA